jgi:recombinational DNA repair protein (RecF pathway)
MVSMMDDATRNFDNKEPLVGEEEELLASVIALLITHVGLLLLLLSCSHCATSAEQCALINKSFEAGSQSVACSKHSTLIHPAEPSMLQQST